MLELGQSRVMWLALWFVLNVAVTLSNKALFQFSGFTFPVSVSLAHMASSSAFSHAVVGAFAVPVRELRTTRERVTVVLFSVLFCLNILTGNIGLRFVPVSLVQCVRSTIPGITMALSMLVLGRRYSRNHFVAVALVVAGVLLATYSTLDFHPVGFAFTVTVCFLSSLKSVVTNKFLVSAGLRFHPFDLLRKMASLSLVHLLVLWVLTGEAWRVVDWVAENGTARFVTVIGVNAFMAFFLNVTNFFFTKLTSALTVTIVGNCKHVVTILLSIAIFRNPVSLLNAIGIFVTIVGAASYSAVDYRDAVAKGVKPSAV
jgi:drug/metabolite transporter (DMT)-like permease